MLTSLMYVSKQERLGKFYRCWIGEAGGWLGFEPGQQSHLLPGQLPPGLGPAALAECVSCEPCLQTHDAGT